MNSQSRVINDSISDRLFKRAELFKPIKVTIETISSILFYAFFVIFLAVDVLLRWVLTKWTSGRNDHDREMYSLVNLMATEISGGGRFEPQISTFSKKNAYLLSAASQLCYEDEDIIRRELEKADFDVTDKSFQIVANKSTFGYVAAHPQSNSVVLVWRGTNPLNTSNVVTDIQHLLLPICEQNLNAGKVHEGFNEAVGSTDIPEEFRTGLLEAAVGLTALRSTTTHPPLWIYNPILLFLQTKLESIWSQILELLMPKPFFGPKPSPGSSAISDKSAYVQACIYVNKALQHLKETNSGAEEPQFFIAGHSLGGALGTVFLAKLTLTNSNLLQRFAGLYSFGCPRCFDSILTTHVGVAHPNKLYRVVNHNDCVPRLAPMLFTSYSDLPGSLVWLKSNGTHVVDPPNLGPPENVARASDYHQPRALPHIDFYHAAGVFDPYIRIRMKTSDNKLRRIYRYIAPFYLNDHVIGDYTFLLKNIAFPTGEVSYQPPQGYSTINGKAGSENGYSEVDRTKYGKKEE